MYDVCKTRNFFLDRRGLKAGRYAAGVVRTTNICILFTVADHCI